MQQKIVLNLWFDGNALDAAEYYTSVFPDGKVVTTDYYPKENLPDFQKDMAGKVLTVEFELGGQRFVAINAGPEFRFNESMSLAISCKDQEEIDYYWSKLSSVPESEQCGWCKDKFGVSWQVVPENMGELMKGPDAYAKMLNMKKLVIADF